MLGAGGEFTEPADVTIDKDYKIYITEIKWMVEWSCKFLFSFLEHSFWHLFVFTLKFCSLVIWLHKALVAIINLFVILSS